MSPLSRDQLTKQARRIDQIMENIRAIDFETGYRVPLLASALSHLQQAEGLLLDAARN